MHRNLSMISRLIGVALLAFWPGVAAAQLFQSDPAQPAAGDVKWEIMQAPAPSRPGESTTLRMAFDVDDGWKMYAMDSPAGRPLQVTFDDLPAGLSLGTMSQSEPKEGYDPNFQEDVRYFDDKGEVTAEIHVSDDAGAGTYEVTGKITRMLCNDKMCLPPRSQPFEASVVVVAGEARSDLVQPPAETTPPAEAAPPTAGPVTAPEAEAEVAPVTGGTSEAGGLFGFLLLAIGAGLAALLMPCVFPMIPLTVSYFTKHAGSRSEAIRMASVYGLAIILTFTGLGVLMAILVGAAGAQTIAANPWVNLFIGLIFVVFALSLLGLFELRLPTGLLNFFNRKSTEQKGYVGVLFMGLTLTLVSFSCTAPFVGGLLATAAGGEWGYPVIGMLAFSTTFALPFFLFALFPKGLSSLPRSGSWMNTLKVVLGFVEMAAAIKFLSNADLVWGWGIISRPVAIALTSVILFIAGIYLLGKLRLTHEPAVEHIGVFRLVSSIAFFGFSLYILPGLFGAPLGWFDAYLPPRQASDVSLLAGLSSSGVTAATHETEGWYVDDIEAALLESRKEGKPIFVDFTGYTCTNCRQMEANVFPNASVRERLERDFVRVKLYTDGLENGETFQRYQLRLTGTVALPTYAVITANEDLIVKHSGIASVEDFIAFLERGKSRYASEYGRGVEDLADGEVRF